MLWEDPSSGDIVHVHRGIDLRIKGLRSVVV